MKQNTIKLNEGQLKKIVAESVKRVLKEEYDWNPSKYQNVAFAFEQLNNVINVLLQKQSLPENGITESSMMDDAINSCNELLFQLNDVRRADKDLNEGYDERYNSFLGDDNYMETVKNSIIGMYNTIISMEDKGNKNSLEATNYLIQQFDDKHAMLNRAWKVVKSILIKQNH